MSEKVLGSLVVHKWRWRWTLLPPKSYTLLFTPNRLIGAKFKLFTGGKTQKMVSRISKGELKEVSFESILKADKDNFEIPYSEITQIEMKKISIVDKVSSSFSTSRYKWMHSGTLEIHTLSEVVRFEITIQKGHDFEECVRILRLVLPEKLVLK